MAVIIENSRLIKLLNTLLPTEVIALTFGPVIIFEGQSDPITVNHESIHCQQYMETLYIGFLLIYMYDYLKNRWNGMNATDAYENIRAEKEAYNNEHNNTYLSTRKRFQWLS